MEEVKVNKNLILREKLAIQRTHLANQTTFLAFLRASMYFLLAGFTINKLEIEGYSRFFEILMYSIAAVLIVVGVINYIVNDKKIDDNQIHIGDYKLKYEKRLWYKAEN